MRSGFVAIFTVCWPFWSTLALSQEQKTKPIEQQRIDAANDKYDRELEEAAQAYKKAAENARKRLSLAYDEQIKSLMRRGGGEALDLANQLNTDKKAFDAEAVDDADVGRTTPSPSQEEIVRLITKNEWWMYWEDPSQRLPQKYLAKGELSDGVKWSVQRRWVLRFGPHYLILMDDQKSWRGFFAPQFREVNVVLKN